MRKWFIYQLYRLLRPYIQVEAHKHPLSYKFYFSLRIFDEKIAEIKYTDLELVEKVNI